MRKIAVILLVLIISISLPACSFINISKLNKKPRIEIAALTKEETKILELFGIGADSKIFDYKVDSKAKVMKVKLYTLDENMKWIEKGSSAGNIKDSKGRIAVSINNKDSSFRVAFQNKGGMTATGSAAQLWRDVSGLSKGAAWANSSDIVYGQEIPLVIQIATKSNAINAFDVYSFSDMEKLKGHDTVIAITITFLQEELD